MHRRSAGVNPGKFPRASARALSRISSSRSSRDMAAWLPQKNLSLMPKQDVMMKCLNPHSLAHQLLVPHRPPFMERGRGRCSRGCNFDLKQNVRAVNNEQTSQTQTNHDNVHTPGHTIQIITKHHTPFKNSTKHLKHHKPFKNITKHVKHHKTFKIITNH